MLLTKKKKTKHQTNAYWILAKNAVSLTCCMTVRDAQDNAFFPRQHLSKSGLHTFPTRYQSQVSQGYQSQVSQGEILHI